MSLGSRGEYRRKSNDASRRPFGPLRLGDICGIEHCSQVHSEFEWLTAPSKELQGTTTVDSTVVWCDRIAVMGHVHVGPQLSLLPNPGKSSAPARGRFE